MLKILQPQPDMETPPRIPTTPFNKIHLIEILGVHHGSGAHRIRIDGETMFQGSSTEEAIGKAVLSGGANGHMFVIKKEDDA